MSTLGRRLVALEAASWERHKRQVLRDTFTDVAGDRRWTADEVEREVQVALDEFARMEPTLRAMCRQGKTLREVLAWLAEEMGIDADELLTEVERSGPIGGGGRS